MNKNILPMIVITLGIILAASLALSADYDPSFQPKPLYDRTRPTNSEELIMKREERAVLRVHGIRKRPLSCEFKKLYQYLPYDRYNLVLICDQPMSIYK